MLEPTFSPPDAAVSKRETKKRLELMDWFSDYMKGSVTGLLVSGSMSYGQNYSVKPSSDIDMQLLVTPDTIEQLLQTDCFDRKELEWAIKGYRKGLYKQFSLVFKKDDVPMECHFWDENQFMEAISFAAQNTKRLRSNIDTPSRDFGYSFDRAENVLDYYGEMVDGFAVADFNSYRIVDNKMYLCRPITNVLGIPIVQIGSPRLDAAIEQCWQKTAQHLREFAKGGEVNPEKLSIVNTLPGMNKMSPEVIKQVQAKTDSFLQRTKK